MKRKSMYIGIFICLMAVFSHVSAGRDVTDVISSEKQATIEAPPRERMLQGEDCSDPLIIDMSGWVSGGGNVFFDTGDTGLFANQYTESDYGCGYSLQAPEVVYQFTPPENIGLQIDLVGSDYDTFLVITDNCPGGTWCIYNDDWNVSPQSGFSCQEFTGGVTYYLFIEGFNGAYGLFALNVRECDPDAFMQCEETALMGQRPSYEVENWNTFTSDEASSETWFENYDVTGNICSIRWWGFTQSGENAQRDECIKNANYTIAFYTDESLPTPNAGGPSRLPGTPYATFNVSPLRTATGHYYYGAQLYQYDITLENCVDLLSGWVSIRAQIDPQSPGCMFYWLDSPEGDSTCYVDYGEGGQTFAYNLSICLNGLDATPTPTVTETPIPTDTPTLTPTNIPTDTPTQTPTLTTTPTPSPTLTPTPSATDTPDPTSTPTATATHSPTSTPTSLPPTHTPTATATQLPPTATPVPECDTLGVTIEMPSDLYGPGDVCWVNAHLCNNDYETREDVPVCVLIDLAGSYWFWPVWSEAFNVSVMDLEPGLTTLSIVPMFNWPTYTPAFNDAVIFGALLNAEMSELVGDYGFWRFSWL